MIGDVRRTAAYTAPSRLPRTTMMVPTHERSLLFLLAALLCIPPLTGLPRDVDAAQRFMSTPAPVPLVELYTSEGCSSCPPADRWLSGLLDDPALWSRIVPIALHVDYWDDLGWRDRLASPFHGLRQRRYAETGHLSQVYTPGVLVNGREWTGWADHQPLPLDRSRRPGVLSVEMVDAVRLRVQFQADDVAADRLQAAVAVLGFGLDSQVQAGENAGKALTHDFVVLGMIEVPLQRQGRHYDAELLLPPLSQPAGRLALAAWVSATGSPLPLQAVGGWLQPH